jgi:hypothetical protein
VADEPAVRVAGVRFGERDATAEPQDAAADLDPVTRSQRRQQADLQLDRGEARAGGKQGGRRAARGGVQRRAQQSAVDDAEGVVGRFVGGAAKYGLAVADRHELSTDQRGHRRGREPALEDGL